MTKTDVAIIGIFIIVVIAVLSWESSYTERTCKEQMSRARTSTDSIVVYGQRPVPNFLTCQQALH